MGSIFAVTAFAAVVAILWIWFVERAAVGFGRLTPKITLVLDPYYWFHERHWHLSGLWLLIPVLAGTPFKNVLSRVQGVRLGKKVFDDGFQFNEYSLIEIGDYTNLNVEGLIQGHTLEEAVFKSDYVKIGAGCTVGCAANIHYGVTLGDYVVLDPNSFMMKGEIADDDTTWRGNPARAVGDGPVRGAEQTSSAFVQAKVA
jgi:non-ribosomal peptide synthetase-like protein